MHVVLVAKILVDGVVMVENNLKNNVIIMNMMFQHLQSLAKLDNIHVLLIHVKILVDGVVIQLGKRDMEKNVKLLFMLLQIL